MKELLRTEKCLKKGLNNMAEQGEKIISYALKQVGKGYQSFGLADEWCARFVWKAAEACGFLGKYYSQTDGAGTQPRLSVPKGYGKFYIADGKYKPQKGDCVLYRYSADSNYSDIYHSDHIGFVTSNNDSNDFTTVEGNTNGANYATSSVNTFNRKINQANVHGFYVPKFNLLNEDDTKVADLTEITKGDKGNFVLAYKSLLIQAYMFGLIRTKVDESNSFGDGTYTATKEVQKLYNLVVDGIAGVKTIATLRNAVNNKIETAKKGHNALIDDLIKTLTESKV